MDKKEEKYIYTDKANKPLYRQTRYYENGEKKFYSESFVDGKWVTGNKDVEKVLYKLPSVIEAVKKAEKIYWVEGEKDVETLLKRGLVATTIANGAGGKLPQDLTNTLEGANIVILPDNDQVGQEFATRVANSLTGYASTVKILDLTKKWPDLKEKGDITDVFEMVNNDEEVLKGLNELEAKTGLYVNIKNEKSKRPQQKDIKIEELDLELKIPLNYQASKEKGISQWKIKEDGASVLDNIIPILVLISKVLKNIATDEEKVELVFYSRKKWNKLIVDKNVLYNTQNIVSLSNKGIPVTSVNSKMILTWLYKLEMANYDTLKIELVTNKMGWVDDKTFVPFRNNNVHLELEDGIKSWLDRIGEKKRNH